jgi:excinuclease UvrABC ATPase subunit
MPEQMPEEKPEIWRFSAGLHCPESDLRYTDQIPSMFSFNSAVGACDTCRGFSDAGQQQALKRMDRSVQAR